MIIVILGPTGVGKTKMSIELAKKYNAIIVNADSVQVYKELNIGSSKVTEKEKEIIPHFLLDIKEPSEDYSVKNFQDDIRKILEDNKDKNIIIVGGTGLYITAALYDYRFFEEDERSDYSKYSNEELYQMALKKDTNMDIHPNNRQRLERFLDKENIDNVEPKLLYPNALFIGLTTDRNHLYKLIDDRVDYMIDNGLLKENLALHEKYPKSRVLSSAIGYKEFIPYLRKEISLEDVVEQIKKDSRHYAKRQYTWFNNKMNVKWFDVNYKDFSKTIKEVEDYITKASN